jgi:uncharacterized protein (TIGR00661 family)
METPDSRRSTRCRPLIHYAVCGEGRGHATRVRAAVEELSRDLRVRILACGDAWSFLRRVYAGTDVAVTRIPGLRFAYSREGMLDYVTTGVRSLRYFRRFAGLVDFLAREMERERPALAITDFEPALPVAARRAGVPLVSFDHQHFLTAFDLRELPLRLRARAAFLSPFVRLACRGQARTIVSSFYDVPLRPEAKDAVRVGVLLRPEVLRAVPTDEGHLVAYIRRNPTPRVLDALARLSIPVRVYGLGARPRQGRLDFRPTANETFVTDLASARALVATAGNQLLGEALYLGKPILTFPEPGNFEQEINAFFLPRTGGGEAYAADRLSPALLRQFLERHEWYRDAVEPGAVAGNVPAAAAIRGVLRSPARRSRPGIAGEPAPVYAS